MENGKGTGKENCISGAFGLGKNLERMYKVRTNNNHVVPVTPFGDDNIVGKHLLDYWTRI